MKLYGQFKNIDNEIIKVVIVSDGDTSTSTEIVKENGIMFGEQPVIVETNVPELTDVFIMKTCRINLLCSNYLISPLFANNAHSVIVNVTKGSDCIFAGYAEPNMYSQGYANPLEVIELNCTDALQTFQYINYKQINENTYENARRTVSVLSFSDILLGAFTPIIADLNVSDIQASPQIYFDVSKKLLPRSTTCILDDLTISDRNFIGKKYDDVEKYETVIEKILRYLNLHIEQIGFDFYIFDWATRRLGRNTWYNLTTGQDAPSTVRTTVTLTSANHASNDTNITVDDVYNQFKVNCELEDQDVVIDSPLDRDSLYSLYTGRQLLFRQYYANTAGNLYRLLEDQTIESTDECKTIEWYGRPLLNKHWKFNVTPSTEITTYYLQENNRYVDMWNIPYQLKLAQMAVCPFSFGSVEKNGNKKDNKIKGKLSMSDYIYISVHGTHDTMSDPNNEIPADETIRDHNPIMEFTGGGSGVYSPSSSTVTNYLVIGGKIMLQRYAPIYSGEYAQMQQSADTAWSAGDFEVQWRDHKETVDGKDHYYCLKGFKMKNPTDTVDETKYVNGYTTEPPTYPYEDKRFKFKYMQASPPRFRDKMMKIPILECELIIGNKRLIEQDLDEWGNSILKWVTIGQEPTWTDPDDGTTYTLTTFTIGFNPATDDYVIGQEYDITNTCKPEYNLDIEGTAIPIRKSDNLSGAVIFRILGPVNVSWQDIERKTVRHFLWWHKHDVLQTDMYQVLRYVENIIIKDFSIKLTTTNSGEEVYDEQELVYLSEEQNIYINKNEDITFELITNPTPEQCEEKHIKNKTYLNAVSLSTGGLLSKLTNMTKLQLVTPEQDYVDDYYELYSRPKVVLETTVHNARVFDYWNKFTSTPLGRTFYPIAIDEDVYMNTKKLTLRET